MATPLIDSILATAQPEERLWPRIEVTISEDTIPEGYGVSIFEDGPRKIHVSIYRKDALKHAASCGPHTPLFIDPENNPNK